MHKADGAERRVGASSCPIVTRLDTAVSPVPACAPRDLACVFDLRVRRLDGLTGGLAASNFPAEF